MPQVSIIMGSDSDMPVMAKTAEILEQFGVSYEMRILSAHRQPEALGEYVKGLKDKGCKVVIAGAGKAAALPGVCASFTPLPVVGIPMKTSDLGGVDSLYSIVQMPTGVPVATVAINGGANAGLLALQMMAAYDENLAMEVDIYRASQAASCNDKDAKLQAEGYKAFL